MRYLKIFPILFIAFFLFSCEKDAKEEKFQDVTFSVTHIDPFDLKSDEWDIECPEDLTPVKAHIIINGDDYYPLVFFVDGKLYTQALKLAPATYTVSKFVLLDAADEIVMAMPAQGSQYAVYVPKTVDFEFEVTEFEKAQVDVAVLCYEDAFYNEFGFTWFYIDRIVIRTMCFFGDICMKNSLDYENSEYAGQDGFPATGGFYDAPAIFKIVVKKDGVEVEKSPFSNLGWLGVGEPLCVEYPDRLDVPGEEFTFELKVLLRVGNTFDYVHLHTWTVTDDEKIPTDEFGIVDFVVGTCNYNPSPFTEVLPPYQNLPKAARVELSALVTGTGNNSVYPKTGGYWGVKTVHFIPNTGINAVPQSGYEFPEIGQSAIGWCGDAQKEITGGNHNFEIYSTLFDGGWVLMRPHMTIDNFKRINWLFNNIHLLTDEDGINYGYSQLTGLYVASMTMPGDDDDAKREAAKDLQHAIWIALGQSVPSGIVGGGTPSARANRMAQLAIANGNTFIPFPGTYAGVLLVKDNAEAQLVFIIVDP